MAPCLLLQVTPKKRSREAEKSIELFIPNDVRAKRTQNTPHGILLLGSTSGLLNSKLWDISLQKLIEIVQKTSHTPSKEIALFTDNLEIHRQPASIQNPLEKGLYQFYFPPNCSHWIQPLDNLLFAALQKKTRKLCEERFVNEFFWKFRRGCLQKLVMECCLDAIEEIFTARLIRKSFANVGLSPWSDDVIIERAVQSVAIILGPIPPERPSPKQATTQMIHTCKETFQKMHQACQDGELARKG